MTPEEFFTKLWDNLCQNGDPKERAKKYRLDVLIKRIEWTVCGRDAVAYLYPNDTWSLFLLSSLDGKKYGVDRGRNYEPGVYKTYAYAWSAHNGEPCPETIVEFSMIL